MTSNWFWIGDSCNSLLLLFSFITFKCFLTFFFSDTIPDKQSRSFCSLLIVTVQASIIIIFFFVVVIIIQIILFVNFFKFMLRDTWWAIVQIQLFNFFCFTNITKKNPVMLSVFNIQNLGLIEVFFFSFPLLSGSILILIRNSFHPLPFMSNFLHPLTYCCVTAKPLISVHLCITPLSISGRLIDYLGYYYQMNWIQK